MRREGQNNKRGSEIKYTILEKTIEEYVSGGEAWIKPAYQWNKIDVEGEAFGSGHRMVIEDFARAIIEDREPLVSGEGAEYP